MSLAPAEAPAAAQKVPKAARLARFLPRRMMLARLATRRSEVGLTFDDGPHPIHTPQILDILRQRGAAATFFVQGRAARDYPAVLRRIVAEGHNLGCHTDTHADLSRLGIRAAWRECMESKRSIESLSGQPVRLLRPPWGRIRPSTFLVAIGCGMRLAFWNVDSLDHRNISPEEIVDGLRSTELRAGDILLFHDDGANTAAALPEVLDLLQCRGLTAAYIPS